MTGPLLGSDLAAFAMSCGLLTKLGQPDARRILASLGLPEILAGDVRDALAAPDRPIRRQHIAAALDRVDAVPPEEKAERAFLRGLDELTRQARSVSHSPAATNYAPKAMDTAGLAGALSVAELEDAMARLLADGRVVARVELPWRTKHRDRVYGLARARLGEGIRCPQPQVVEIAERKETDGV